MNGRWLVIISLGLLALCSPNSQAPEPTWMRELPPKTRATFLRDFDLLVHYQKTEQWPKLFDLLAEGYIQGQSKEEYVRRSRMWSSTSLSTKLLELNPRNTVVHEMVSKTSGPFVWWTIEGCAKVRQQHQTQRLEAGVEAYFEHGKWSFSEVTVLSPIDGAPRLCDHAATPAKPNARNHRQN